MPFFRKSEEERPPKPARELLELRAAVEKAQLPEAASRAALKELERLEKTEPSVAEYSIGLNYLDFLISLPWNRVTEDNLDLKRAERILESQLYDLQQVKERLLEYLAMRTLAASRPPRCWWWTTRRSPAPISGTSCGRKGTRWPLRPTAWKPWKRRRPRSSTSSSPT